MSGESVVIVATYAEAHKLGARKINNVLRMPGTSDDRVAGARIISANCYAAALDGLRVGDIFWTTAAEKVPQFEKIRLTLERNRAKTAKSNS